MKTNSVKRIGTARRLIGSVLIILVIAFAVYLAAVMNRRIAAVVLKADYKRIFLYEMAVCGLFLILALDVRFGFFTLIRLKPLKALGWLLRILVICASCAVLFFIGRVTAGSMINTAGPAGYAVTLGLALENGKPTDDLLSRVSTAGRYMEENPQAVLILTGGNPDESGRTEAAVMRDLLLERGIPESRMILEDQARTTKDNFANTALLMDPGEPIILISSDYHMDRAVRTAESAGFTNVMRLPAPSSLKLYGANVMWEVIMEMNELKAKPRPSKSR